MQLDGPSVLPPDQRKLTSAQATRLSTLANVSLKEVAGYSIGELSEKLKWKVPPEWLLFRRICGKVVRTDPSTGVTLPVPFATVHVLDTDCDFLGYFPLELPWVWCFPLYCHTEQIASVVTDACGNFCVWVPRFDIDWVIRWRARIRCYPEIFVRPNLGDLLKYLQVTPGDFLPPHGPGPDPGPFVLNDGGLTLERVASIVGRPTAMRLAAAESAMGSGQNANVEFQELLSRPAFPQPVPPPLSPKLEEVQRLYKEGGHQALGAMVRGVKDRTYDLDLNRYLGPFLRWRCVWTIQKELVPILEVPDITFRVTQDVDGDGVQETIYSECCFDVNWNSGSDQDVTLHASPLARPATTCDVPVLGECGAPMIHFAGLMPATSSYIDAGGFGIRTNPPHKDGVDRSSVFPPAATLTTPADTPANAPFTGTVQLYGCNQYPNGHYYRLLYSYNGADPVPFTNRAWWLDPWPGPGTPIHIVPDAQGWYPILNNPDDWFPPHELLDWPTAYYPDGLYTVTLQIADAGKNPIALNPAPAPIAFYVDNSAQAPYFLNLAWRVAGATTWNYFPDLVCPVVHRPASGGAPVDIEFHVEYQASMPHLLKTVLTASGCGGGAPQASSPPTDRDPYSHWHENALDNTVHQTADFTLSGSALQGAYGFTLKAYSRAFNPAGGDAADPQGLDWYYDAQSLNWNYAFLPVAVVNL